MTREELDRFAEQTYASLIRFLRKRVPDQEAQDLAQDCMAVFVQHHERVENDRSYLFAVAYNRVAQFYKQRRREGGLAATVFDSQNMPMSVLSTRLSIKVARQNDLAIAMQTLPRRQFDAIDLHYGERLTLEQTAEVLNISKQTVSRDVKAGRETLTARLGSAGGVLENYVRT